MTFMIEQTNIAEKCNLPSNLIYLLSFAMRISGTAITCNATDYTSNGVIDLCACTWEIRVPLL